MLVSLATLTNVRTLDDTNEPTAQQGKVKPAAKPRKPAAKKSKNTDAPSSAHLTEMRVTLNTLIHLICLA
jgi:hypothetical protein